MICQPEYVRGLLRKYIEGSASPLEVARLMAAWDIYDDDELSDMIAEITGGPKAADMDQEPLLDPDWALNAPEPIASNPPDMEDGLNETNSAPLNSVTPHTEVPDVNSQSALPGVESPGLKDTGSASHASIPPGSDLPFCKIPSSSPGSEAHDTGSLEPGTMPTPLRGRYSTLREQLAAVACFLLIVASVGMLIWFVDSRRSLRYSCYEDPRNPELPTGRYTSRLTLANNCFILVDSTYRGVIATQDGVEIRQPEPGMIVYSSASVPDTKGSDLMYNTIATSGGQQYRIVLPDGTKVRLNAASSIRFPVRFGAGSRVVHVTGEAFFDVAHDSTAPFYVKAGNSEIRVLGTTFNVNAYSRNSVTTLLTGSLEIKGGSGVARLSPGERAIVWDHSAMRDNDIEVGEADIRQAVSWKNVRRTYTDIPMREFVADMGRWYQLDIVNLSCVPAGATISASLCYDTPVEDILSIFTNAGLRYVRTGNKITFCKPAVKASA